MVFAALAHYRLGEFQEAYQDVQKSLSIFPMHSDSKELSTSLNDIFTVS
jgi:hypothetical protein